MSTGQHAGPADEPRADGPSTGPLVDVDDPADDRLADYRDLKEPAAPRLRERGQDGEAVFVVEGKIAVRELLRTDHEVVSLLVDRHQARAAADLVAGVRRRGAPVYVGDREVVAGTVGFNLHRGVVAMARRPPSADPVRVLAAAAATRSAGEGPPVVAVLEGLNDHVNIGAIFRNAAAFGVAAVLLDPKCADPLYRRSVRVSSGHVLHVPFARLAPWPGALAQLRAAGFAVVALAPRTPSVHAEMPIPAPLPEWLATRAGAGRLAGVPSAGAPAAGPVRESASDRGGPVAVVLGAEGPGLSQSALEAADAVVAIPMASSVDSLNVATAAAIAFHRLAGPG
ncbi:MAG: TrmH family RNA methyltransferase [Acidimicrobiales bacterium]